MGHDYHNPDEILETYIKGLSFDDEDWEEPFTTMDVDENLLGPDVLKKVEKVHEQVLSA